MAKEFNAASFFARWLFATLLVFGTYNPSSFSYVSWLMAESTEFGPVPALVGVILLIAWIIFLRATFMSLGLLGICLSSALFGCVVWLLIDLGLLSMASTGAITYLVLAVLSLVLATGMSWSHIRRRLTGQVDVDEIEN